MNITFIGCGNVGAALADNLQRCGHAITLATANPRSESVAKARQRNAAFQMADPATAVAQADVIFLATPFQAAEAALRSAGSSSAGKIVVDCTNPIGAGLSHGLANVHSGTGFLQQQFPTARLVKAFTIYGYENFENSRYPAYAVKPAMLFCGNDANAKRTVGELITQLDWEPVDVGGVEQALHLEHMTLLWVRMVRVHGHSPNLVWAALRR